MLTKEQRVYTLHILRTALGATAESHRLTGRTRDGDAKTNMAIQWGAITASYSGLEQTLKYLVAVERKKTIEGVRNRLGKDGHDLSKIFGFLEKGTKEILQEHYAVYQSLHSYINMPTLDKFLCGVSSAPDEQKGAGRGYERWRYLLIEEEFVPPNSAEAMLFIWSTAVRIAERKEWPEYKSRMLKNEIAKEILDRLNRFLDRSRSQSNQGRYKWRVSAGVILNAFAQFIWNHERGRPDISGDAPQEVRVALERWLEALDKEEGTTLSHDTWCFIERARGRTPLGRSIRWNDELGKFENVPWNPCPMTSEKCPEDAIERDCYNITRRDLVRGLYQDFTVSEWAQPAERKLWKRRLWTRTVSAFKRTDQGEEWRVEIWQRCLDKKFWVTWKGGESEAAKYRKFHLGLRTSG